MRWRSRLATISQLNERMCTGRGRRVVWRLHASCGDGIVCDGGLGRARTAVGSRDIEHLGSAHDEAKSGC